MRLSCHQAGADDPPEEPTMDWISGLAEDLGVAPLTAHETEHLLTTSRQVAHRVERKITPLSTYVLGLAVGTRLSEGGSTRDAVLDDVLHLLIQRLPEAPPEAS
jgi:hypothetical protein